MYWNNRIYKHVDKDGNISYGLHETFYDIEEKKDSKPCYTVDSMIGLFESPEDMIESLKLMLSDAEKYKDNILEYEMGD